MSRPKWTKTNFEVIARVVAKLDGEQQARACNLFVDELRQKNENFNEEMFRKRCNETYKYKSCSAAVGFFCKKHQAVHTEKEVHTEKHTEIE